MNAVIFNSISLAVVTFVIFKFIKSVFHGNNGKKLFTVTLLILAGSNSIFAGTNGWAQQTSGVTSYLANVKFVNTQTGWAVGDGGKILKTTNGGGTWNLQTAPVSVNFSSVSFIDNLTGWISGSLGAIISTTNGGTNWIAQTSGNSNNLNIFFVNSSTGWAFGGNGTLSKTTNGGTNWIAQTSGTASFLTSAYFIDINTGWMCGLNGTIISTTNGGITWSAQSSSLSNELYTIYFINSTTGWMGGVNGNLRKTTNGGTNWFVQSTGTTDALLSIYFANSSTGWASSNNGKIFVTINGGASWALQSTTTSQSIVSISFGSILNGWGVGTNGSIIVTSTGGFTLPAAPSGLTASVISSSQINLSWTDNSSDEIYFKIQRSFDNNNWSLIDSVSANTTTYQNTGLQGSTMCYYRIYSYNFAGGSPYSNTASGLTYPEAPVLQSPPNNSTFISLTPQLQWSGSGAALYRLQLSTDSLFATTLINDSTLTTTNYTVQSGVLQLNIKYYWRVSAKNATGSGSFSSVWNFRTGITGIIHNGSEVPSVFKLYDNYPNPFNPTTKIKFDVPQNVKSEMSNLKLEIFDLLGQCVETLINQNMQPGRYEVEFDASKLSSGVYFYRVAAGNFTDIKKMMLIK